MQWLDWYADMTDDQKKLVDQNYAWSRTYYANELKQYRAVFNGRDPEYEMRLENAALEALFRAVKYYQEGKGTKFRTFFHLVWQHTIARTRQKTRTYHRYRSNYQQSKPLDEVYSELPHDFDDNQQSELIQKIVLELDLLDEKDQIIFQRCFWEGKNDPEIGRELGYTKANIWRRKKIALDRIRRAMGARTRSSRVA